MKTLVNVLPLSLFNLATFEITNPIGERIIPLSNLSVTETTINTSQLPNGLCLISVKSGDTLSQFKFIKQ